MKRTFSITVFALVAILGLTACDKAAQPAPAPSDIGGSFQLTSDSGARVDERLLKGKWSVVYFGYTFCPDVCPATLAQLAAFQIRLQRPLKAGGNVSRLTDLSAEVPHHVGHCKS